VDQGYPLPTNGVPTSNLRRAVLVGLHRGCSRIGLAVHVAALVRRM
jgi:hypothetical protein